MKITNQLFQPMLEKIEREYQELLGETQNYYSGETLELRGFVQKKLRQLEMVKVSLSYMQQADGDPLDLRETLRQHKLELRFARRRWKRQLGTKSRRNQDQRDHVPTFAA